MTVLQFLIANSGGLILALLIDRLIGEPEWLWARIPHPVVLMGRILDRGDFHLNRGAWHKFKGCVFMIVAVAGLWMLGMIVARIPGFGVVEVLLAAILLSQGSLVNHVENVADSLMEGVEPGKRAVSRIVGRDVACLDESGISKAAVESAAEGFSDGVVSPAMWYMLFGLPGILAFKFVNTADSMIGHRNERHAEFGWAAAKMDDAMCWLPSRVAGLLIVTAARSREAMFIMTRNAPLHRSPNAGWPEAAMAGVLNVALGGSRSYGGRTGDLPLLNPAARRSLSLIDIRQAVKAIEVSHRLLCMIVFTLFVLLLIINSFV